MQTRFSWLKQRKQQSRDEQLTSAGIGNLQLMEQRTLLVRCKKEIPMFLVKLIDPINYVRETLSPLKMKYCLATLQIIYQSKYREYTSLLYMNECKLSSNQKHTILSYCQDKHRLRGARMEDKLPTQNIQFTGRPYKLQLRVVGRVSCKSCKNTSSFHPSILLSRQNKEDASMG